MLVHNIKGTSDRKPIGYKSWIDFWSSKKGYEPPFCYCMACTEDKNLVGAHVQEAGGNTRDYWYIVPLCKKHNNFNNDKSFEVDKSDLVRVNYND